jgi:hypothetical protein
MFFTSSLGLGRGGLRPADDLGRGEAELELAGLQRDRRLERVDLAALLGLPAPGGPDDEGRDDDHGDGDQPLPAVPVDHPVGDHGVDDVVETFHGSDPKGRAGRRTGPVRRQGRSGQKPLNGHERFPSPHPREGTWRGGRKDALTRVSGSAWQVLLQ